MSVAWYSEFFYDLATRSGVYEAHEVLVARYFARLCQDIQDDQSTTQVWTVEEAY